MNDKWFGTVILALLVLVGDVNGCGGAGFRDLGIALDISHQIERYPQFTIFDYVSGTVENGVVTLTGKVTMPFKKNDIARKPEKSRASVKCSTASTCCRCRSTTISCGSGSPAPSTATRPSGNTAPWPTRRFTSSWKADTSR